MVQEFMYYRIGTKRAATGDKAVLSQMIIGRVYTLDGVDNNPDILHGGNVFVHACGKTIPDQVQFIFVLCVLIDNPLVFPLHVAVKSVAGTYGGKCCGKVFNPIPKGVSTFEV